MEFDCPELFFECSNTFIDFKLLRTTNRHLAPKSQTLGIYTSSYFCFYVYKIKDFGGLSFLFLTKNRLGGLGLGRFLQNVGMLNPTLFAFFTI